MEVGTETSGNQKDFNKVKSIKDKVAIGIMAKLAQLTPKNPCHSDNS